MAVQGGQLHNIAEKIQAATCVKQKFFSLNEHILEMDSKYKTTSSTASSPGSK